MQRSLGLQVLLWAALHGWKQEQVEYAVAAVPGGLAVSLSVVQLARRTALLKHDQLQEQRDEENSAARARSATDFQATLHRVGTRTHPPDLCGVRPIARLGRRVFLGRRGTFLSLCAVGGKSLLLYGATSYAAKPRKFAVCSLSRMPLRHAPKRSCSINWLHTQVAQRCLMMSALRQYADWRVFTPRCHGTERK